LIALYNSTGGFHNLWTKNDNWGSNKSYCIWQGVKCYPPSLLISLDIENGGPQGPLPSEIGWLGGYINALTLAKNRIFGTLPTELGLLYRLETLNLGHNSISGTLPTTLAQLTKLINFEIAGNIITGIVDGRLKTMLVNCANEGNCKMADNPFTCPVPRWASGCNMACVSLHQKTQ